MAAGALVPFASSSTVVAAAAAAAVSPSRGADTDAGCREERRLFSYQIDCTATTRREGVASAAALQSRVKVPGTTGD